MLPCGVNRDIVSTRTVSYALQSISFRWMSIVALSVVGSFMEIRGQLTAHFIRLSRKIRSYMRRLAVRYSSIWLNIA